MVKDLDDLGARDGFFDVAVDRAEGGLLSRIVFARAFGERLAALGKDRQKQHRDQRQPNIGRDHKDKRSDQRDHARNKARQRVVDHHFDVVDVVGKARHDLARRVGVKIADRELLELGKQIVADGFRCGVRHRDHQSRLQVVAANADQEDARENEHRRKDVGCNRLEPPCVEQVADKGNLGDTRQNAVDDLADRRPRNGAFPCDLNLDAVEDRREHVRAEQ